MSDLRTAYHEEHRGDPHQIVRLAGSVIEAIPRATSILLDGDLEGADYMISADDEIDARSLDLEEEIYRVMALQAPVAIELRTLVVGGEDRGRGRALGRPRGQHLQGGPPAVRARVSIPACGA